MKGLLKFIVLLILIVIAFNISVLAGFLVLLACIGYLVYTNISSIYSFTAKVKYAKGDSKGALERYKKAYDKGKLTINGEVSYGYILLKLGEIEKSEKILRAVTKKNLNRDQEMLVKSNIALVLWKKGDLDGAIDILYEVYDKYKNTTVYGSLGYFLIQKGDFNKALEFNLEAYDYNNTDNVIADNLGQNYYFMGEYDKAEEVYKKLLERSPRFPEAYFYYGNVLFEKGKKDEAIEYMKKSLDYNFSSLSTTSKEDIENRIKYIESTCSEDIKKDEE